MQNTLSAPQWPRRFSISTRSSVKGLTLIELLVTIAILAIILALGVPSFREMLVRNQASSIVTEFANDVSRVRTEAISRNSCVSICMSTNTANALTGATPTCATSGADWQSGWIIFSNPTCSTTINNPTTSGNTLIKVRQAGVNTFTLISNATVRRFTYESRGLPFNGQSNFTLAYTPETVASPHYRSVCVSSAGRVTIKQYAGVSACP
jgi:type IV fimbrial biogenesis protein FimT